MPWTRGLAISQLLVQMATIEVFAGTCNYPVKGPKQGVLTSEHLIPCSAVSGHSHYISNTWAHPPWVLEALATPLPNTRMPQRKGASPGYVCDPEDSASRPLTDFPNSL